MAHPNDYQETTEPDNGDGVEGSLRKINKLLDSGTLKVTAVPAPDSDTPVAATVTFDTKTVAAAATPEALVADSTLVESVTIYALAANTGDAFAGFSSDPQGAVPVVIVAPAGKKIDLADILVRVTVDGEGVAWESID
jgi:hypothetical protein